MRDWNTVSASGTVEIISFIEVALLNRHTLHAPMAQSTATSEELQGLLCHTKGGCVISTRQEVALAASELENGGSVNCF